MSLEKLELLVSYFSSTWIIILIYTFSLRTLLMMNSSISISTFCIILLISIVKIVRWYKKFTDKFRKKELLRIQKEIFLNNFCSQFWNINSIFANVSYLLFDLMILLLYNISLFAYFWSILVSWLFKNINFQNKKEGTNWSFWL